jgi:hypothetical protein
MALRVLSMVMASLPLALVAGCVHATSLRIEPRSPLERLTPAQRLEAIRRAQVWTPTDIPALNLLVGPQGEGSFALGETVTCDHHEKKRGGGTPKFYCAIRKDDVLKVKYGVENGKTFAEVAATRLLWALGFGADWDYSVRVVCNGCTADPWNHPAIVPGRAVFDPAVVERRMAGDDMEATEGPGWKWSELDLVDESQGGAPHAQRDALKLLAVMVQHTDNKRDQQGLLCLPGGVTKVEADAQRCTKPFMMVHDVGLTFGTANLANKNAIGSANYRKWSETPVWKDEPGCVGDLSRSWTGTFHDPVISEEGRQFLAHLLVQLSDQQIHDLFAAAQIERRVVPGERPGQPRPTVDQWVTLFKKKRAEIVDRTCPH